MTKRELRAAARARLAEMDPQERARASSIVAARTAQLAAVSEARVLLLYASLPTEVDTDPIADEARARGAIVTYPRCLAASREMKIHRVDAPQGLRDGGAYGIREPSLDCPVLGLEEIDLALVPGLAWDRQGHRLGRGAGYYDRLFADPAWRGLRVGLFFAAQEVPSVPVDPWDARLHAVVTEHEIWRPA